MIGRFAALVLSAIALAATGSESYQGEGNQCGVSSTPLSFGTYRVSNSSPLDSTAEITLDCNGNRTVNIRISAGSHGQYAERKMAALGGTDRLAYQVYTDQTRQTPWGNGSQGTQIVTVSIHQTGKVTAYARIPARQQVSAGTYTDQLTVTISF